MIKKKLIKMFHKGRKSCAEKKTEHIGSSSCLYGKESDEAPVLSYNDVSVCYGEKTVLSDVSFLVKPGEILGIVGESGSGKSTIIRAALGILGNGGTVAGGTICLHGQDLSLLKEKEMRKFRGSEIGMIFQDTRSDLCPIRTIEDQIVESVAAHKKISREKIKAQALDLFDKFGLKRGKEILSSYPFELSGGMNQRVGIAMAMLLQPSVLMADEPTSALDVIAQKKVVEEFLQLRNMYRTAIVLVTHNIGIVSAMADNILVLHEGKAVEYGSADQVLRSPENAYTKELLAAVPRIRKNSGTEKWNRPAK